MPQTTSMIVTGWTTPSYGGKTSITIPSGPTLAEAIVRTNLIASQLLWVNVKLGTDTIYRVKGTDLQMEERYRERYETQPGDGSQTTAVNEHVINFADIANMGVASRNHTALVTIPGEKITLELEIGAGVGGTPPEIVLELHLEVSDNDPKGRRFLPRRLRGVFSATLLQNNLMPLEMNKNLFYRRVHIETADITKFLLKKDKEESFEKTKERNLAYLKRNDGAPQPGWTHVDFIASDFAMMDVVQGNAVSQFGLKFDISAIDNSVEYIIDTVEDLHPEWGNV